MSVDATLQIGVDPAEKAALVSYIEIQQPGLRARSATEVKMLPFMNVALHFT
jgi:hypothetical protein